METKWKLADVPELCAVHMDIGQLEMKERKQQGGKEVTKSCGQSRLKRVMNS